MKFRASVLVNVCCFGLGGVVTSCHRYPMQPSVTPEAPAVAAPAAHNAANLPYWVVEPPPHEYAVRRISLGQSRYLYLGQQGQRFTTGTDPKRGFDTAISIADEPLVGAIQLRDRSFAFLSSSSRVYEAKSALGELIERHPPVAPTLQAAVGKRGFLVLTQQHKLLRSIDQGTIWTEVQLPAEGFAPVQIALDSEGHGAVLARPERLFVTFDDGATFEPLDTDGGDLESLELTWDGRVIVSAKGLWDDEFEIMGPPAARRLARPHRPWAYPDSQRKLESSTAFGAHFAFVSRPENGETQHRQLALGQFGDTPTFQDVPELDHCEKVVLSGFGDDLEIGCLSRTNPDQAELLEMQLFRKEVGREGVKADGRVGELSSRLLSMSEVNLIWLGPGGWLLAQRPCLDLPCPPNLVRQNQQSQLLPATGLEKASIFGVAFDEARQRAIVAATSEITELQVWQWPLVNAAPNRLELPGLTSEQLSNTRNCAISYDSAAGIVLGLPNGIYQEQPRKAAPGTVPPPQFIEHELGASFVLSGRRGLLFGYGSSAKETTDAGQTWHALPMPLNSVSTTPSCTAAGCAFAETTTMRVGWGASNAVTSLVAVAEASALSSESSKFLAPRKLQCGAAGKAQSSHLASVPMAEDLEPSLQSDVVRVLTDPNGDYDLEFLPNRPSGTSVTVPFLDAVKGNSHSRVEVMSESDWLLAVRISELPRRGKRLPMVDLDFAWYERATAPTPNTIHHGRLEKVEMPERWAPSNPQSLRSQLSFAVGKGGVLVVGAREMYWTTPDGSAQKRRRRAFSGDPFETPRLCRLREGNSVPEILCLSDQSANFFKLVEFEDSAAWYKYRVIELALPMQFGTSRLGLAHWGKLPGATIQQGEGSNSKALFVALEQPASPKVVMPVPVPTVGTTWPACNSSELAWPKLTLPLAPAEPILVTFADDVDCDSCKLGAELWISALVVHMKDSKACASALYASNGSAMSKVMEELGENVFALQTSAVLLNLAPDEISGTLYEMPNGAKGRTSVQPLRCNESP